ncbi:hypothetical protein MBUL_02247 [Methylobacterium bullatum]|uniref:Uncharacterized protein n=1 Tax=Methylobacterium bullatum TaxID=570505 RepID=A0A679J6E4_9HYPH|nr:hypothetical protein MBUL_02247 [Methylobacterium bullatum]
MNARPLVIRLDNGLPTNERLLDLLIGDLKRILPQATWTAASIAELVGLTVERVFRHGHDVAKPDAV